MMFTELPFWLLTGITFVLWWFVRHHDRARVALLLTASLVFYAYHYWPLLFLLLLYCVVDWAVACAIARSRSPGWFLALGVTFNLAILGYWKYTPLLLRTAAQFAGWFHLPEVPAPPRDWVIPFGISFYAFTGIAYLVDVYRKITPAETNFWRYTLSAVFFPHLVAGPILRPSEFLEKLRPEAMPQRPEAPLEALYLIALGLFKKMVLADRIAIAIDPFFTHVSADSTAGVWGLPFAYLYALQIYFDFSGYTDIARGLGLLFGYRWPDNFNLPYLATSIQDFWRRWHITLSTFLKDYLYIPLGGSRHGPWRTNVNLMLTMLLGGLWHGASWSFMIWGGLHGLFLILHRAWSSLGIAATLRSATGLPGLAWRLFGIVLTFHAVCLAWCFFRLTDFTQSLVCIQKWFVFDLNKMFIGGSADSSIWWMLATYGLVVLIAARARALLPSLSTWEMPWQRAPLARGFLWGLGAGVLLLALLLAPAGEKPPFIYFQF